jgi:hypothetical protein
MNFWLPAIKIKNICEISKKKKKQISHETHEFNTRNQSQ